MLYVKAISQLSYSNYGKSIGSDIKRTINYVQAMNTTGDPLVKNVCMDMTLHGDPSIVSTA